ncbi:MAG: 50S ribosomal protein L9 [Firmicutes bacterium]|jgi:large subunit ribosomal protein L9|nr:50S ribosomal protein L9 [Bacillota bacterium]
MRVILTQNVEKIGAAGDVVNVADGYARNYLIPRGMAVQATKANLRRLEHEKEIAGKKALREEEEAKALAGRLSGTTVTITAKTGEGGRLFGSVTSQDIADAVQRQFNVELDRRRIDLPEPIKNLGEYTIPVKLYQGVNAELVVKVIAE